MIYALQYVSKRGIIAVQIELREKIMNYQVGQEVWVKCTGTDTWGCGVVTGVTAKRVRVYNEVRDLEGLYAPQNVEVK
jgi:hypothetical protein|tara:strand:+ start:549 stop:782 length:234 start_codon:yes stop_codon:yes gene_type:complete